MKLVGNEVVTLENIEVLSKTIAVGCIKSYLSFCYIKEIHNMYKNLIIDLCNEHNPEHTLSMGYDLVTEAKVLLFENLGKSLSDEITLESYGNPKTFTLLTGCYFMVRRLINNEAFRGRKCVSLDDSKLLERDIIYNQFEEFEENRNNEDWTNVNRMIEMMNLNNMEKETLECFMMGCTYAQAKEILNRCYATIFERREKIRKKYIATFG